MNTVVGTRNCSDDAPKLHHPSSSWYSAGPMMKVWKKLIYLFILLFTLIVIRTVTDWNIITQAVQHHEPSLRIFRSLFEIALLLLCTSASVSIYTHYISYHMTHDLLFQSVPEHSSNVGNVPSSGQHQDTDDDDDFVKDNADISTQTSGDMNQQVSVTVTGSGVSDDDEVTMLTSNAKSMVFHPSATLYSTGSVPSPISILCMALDLLLWIVMIFLLYLLSAIHAITSQQQADSSSTNDNIIYSHMARIAAPTFPLLLFLFCFLRILQFRKVYSQLYTVISFTLHAPLYDITFRDGMIGDILTSMVRPMQDIAFTVCYILFGLRGWWSDHYIENTEITADLATASVNSLMNEWNNSTGSSDLSHSFLSAADARVPAMERSWILHTAILPACMISPLWWRFLQTMRQCYDTKQRWPYLGNSFKYFFAAQVAMLGVYHPAFQRSPSWILSFVAATLYQIYWDVFMDWGLLVPGANLCSWKLRNHRLYPYKSFYWFLVIINTLLRFCWTLSFVPFHYLSAAGVLTSNFSSEAWSNILVPTIASAEIIRRTLWGLLRVEWEAIKVRNDMSGNDGHLHGDDVDEEFEMTPMKVHGGKDSWNSSGVGARSLHQYKFLKLFTSDMSTMNELQVLGELCLYTTTFAVLGLIIAAHRGTL